MSDEFVKRLKESEAVCAGLSDGALVQIALSELLGEMAMGTDVPPGRKIKCMTLAAELAKRVGVRF